MNDYEKQANGFLKKTGTKFSASFVRNDKYFPEDKEARDIYSITLERGSRIYTFEFGQSLNDSGFKINSYKREIPFSVPDNKREYFLNRENSYALRRYAQQEVKFDLTPNEKIILPEPPSAYDVLACLTKYDPGSFDNFCGEFGYDTDSRTAERTYNAVVNEYMNVKTLYSDNEIEELAQIS